MEESETLRGLHDRLNNELDQRLGNSPADFDGDAHHFQITMIMGGQPFEVYKKYLNEILNPRINLKIVARELTMFVYNEPMGSNGDYLCYKILPIGNH